MMWVQLPLLGTFILIKMEDKLDSICNHIDKLYGSNAKSIIIVNDPKDSSLCTAANMSDSDLTYLIFMLMKMVPRFKQAIIGAFMAHLGTSHGRVVFDEPGVAGSITAIPLSHVISEYDKGSPSVDKLDKDTLSKLSEDQIDKLLDDYLKRRK